MIRIQTFFINSCTFYQCFQSRILRSLKHLQSFFDKDPVLILQIHHVTDRCDCNIFNQIIQISGIFPHAFPQRLHQFICNRRATESLERIYTVLLLRIDHCIRWWKSVYLFSVYFIERDLMMIRYDDRHAQFFAICNLICCCDSIITGNDRIDSGIVSPVDQMPIQTISVTYAVRNITVHICPETFQPLQQNIRRIHTINIIISDHPDFLLLCNLFFQNVNRLIRIFHQHPIIQITDRSIQITFDCLFSDHIPVADQACQSRTNLIFLSYRFKICTFAQQNPSFHLSLSPLYLSVRILCFYFKKSSYALSIGITASRIIL